MLLSLYGKRVMLKPKLLDEWGGSGEVLGGMLSAPEHLGRYILVDASGSTN